ncbi:MAG: GGDEF domain-containing protein [Steroidobacteraceae bacterium]
MRYQQSREESAEILRRALQLMSPHEAGYHPLSYAVWYEHAGQLNPPLSQDLEKHIAAASSLTDAEICRLHALHIAARDVEMFELAQRELRELIGRTEQDTAEAETTLQRFTDALRGATERLTREPSDAVRTLLGNLLSQAAQVQSTLRSLHAQLAKQREEVAGVIERLERAQTEPLRDPLTGLVNLSGFRRALTGQDDPADFTGVVLLAVDVDYFKRINDTHGHVIGDKVLMKVAKVLNEHLAAEDVAARIGGDEFVVLLRGKTLSQAAALGERIRSATQRSLIVHPDGSQFAGEVTLSIGAACGRTGDTLETLRHRADAALYDAKAAGRNRVALAAELRQR